MQSRRAPLFEGHRFRILLVALLALMGAEALGIGKLWGGGLLAPISLAVLAATLLVLARRRAVFWTALVLALPTLRELILPSSADHFLADLAVSGAHAPFFCFAAAALTSQVVRSEHADEETVVGSICAYLFIALAFASLYASLETWSAGSFRFGERVPEARLFDELFYLSLITITTLGYGDIVPVSVTARSLITIEAIFGILFPSIVIARIVSLATSGGGRPFAPPGPATRRWGRFELLLAAEIAVLLVAPALGDLAGTRSALILLTTSLLVAALYAGSDRPSARALGVALATLALAARWWPGSRLVWLEEAGFALEAAFLALVSGSLLLWLFAEKRVTRNLLLASIALYLLFGFSWAAAYQLAELHSPGAFGTPGDASISRSDLVYYSFMTLTTTGFGDIAPLTPIAKRLATLESLLGVLYPPVLVARLVGLYGTK
jgi:hypothetical protein